MECRGVGGTVVEGMGGMVGGCLDISLLRTSSTHSMVYLPQPGWNPQSPHFNTKNFVVSARREKGRRERARSGDGKLESTSIRRSRIKRRWPPTRRTRRVDLGSFGVSFDRDDGRRGVVRVSHTLNTPQDPSPKPMIPIGTERRTRASIIS